MLHRQWKAYGINHASRKGVFEWAKLEWEKLAGKTTRKNVWIRYIRVD